MEKNGADKLSRFDCFSQPSTLGPRWTRWLKSFELFADGKGLIITEDANNATKQRRRALLLHTAGPDVQDIFYTLENADEVTDYNAAVTALNTYFVPKVDSAIARQTFLRITQKPGDTVQQFVTRLRHAAKDCDFGVDLSNQLRDAILNRCTSEYIKRKLLEETEALTLARALAVAEKCERVEHQMMLLSVHSKTKDPESVNKVGEKPNRFPKRNKPKTTYGASATASASPKPDKTCYRCGFSGHYGRDSNCPARGKTCRKCGGKDHFAEKCRTQKKTQVNQVKESESGTKDYVFVISDYEQSNKLNVCVGGVELEVLVDSGATSNIIDEATWETLKTKKVKCKSQTAAPSKKLYSYASKQPLQVKGTFNCEIQAGENVTDSEFLVIKGTGVPLLGKETAMKLNVLKIGIDVAAVTDLDCEIRRQYLSVFQGVGKLKSKQVTLHIDTSVQPVAQPLRRMPFNLREKVETKIDELLDLDIIERVDGPTPWVNPVVVVPKSGGDIRMCLDMRRANEAIIRGRHPIPTVDELLHNMNGSKVFSKLDLKWGYHQLELTPESRDITTFATHCGLYRYKRLLFGVCSASEQYQHEIASALAGIEGADNISDDIIVHGPDQETHDQRLHEVMKRLRDGGLTLNPDKCQFNMDRLIFMGILLSEKGIGPTQDRVKAVVEAREPQNMSEIKSFLGLVGFSSRFIPQFATISEPLRKLTRKGVPFVFGGEQRKAFNVLKQSLTEAATLAYFDKNAPTQVIADASPVGLGAVLVQGPPGNMTPVCYASRSLTECERRYSQTEREALGLVWACEKFHAYVYGMKFDLVTDHKPLEVIYSPRSKPCARIERWVLRLQPYDFKVVHIPGVKNIADPLSRLISSTNESIEHKHGSDEYVQFIAVNATPNALTTRQVEEISKDDAELSDLREAIETGRYDKCKPYAPVAGELCVIGYLVLRGTRLVLPEKLRPQALALAHEGHLGIVGTKQALRTKIWWPAMDKAAEKYCRACHGCQLVARPDLPEPIRSTTLPDGPWEDMAIDLLGPFPSGHSILVVVDYFSRYYEYVIMISTTTDKIIEGLEEIFCRHGLPMTIKSDNGPQFRSDEFKSYCEYNGVKHVKVTAKWAQANGEVERQNASLMKRIRIAQAEGLNWQKELRKYVAKYRGLDHPTTGRSPAELLFKRKVRGRLPEFKIDHQSDMNITEVRDRDAEQKGKAKIYADERRNATYSNVDLGDQVLVRQEKVNKFSTPFCSTPHTIVSKTGNSVIVESPHGAQYSRNTTHVRKYVTNDQVGSQPVLHDTSVSPMKAVDSNLVPAEVHGAQTPPQTIATPIVAENLSKRPSRQTNIPSRFSDYVMT